MITIGSMYSGYGGLELAVAAASALPTRVLWHCEIDLDASHVLKIHHPAVPNIGADDAQDWSRIQVPDVLAGGPPCQGISLAGLRLGPDDPRWRWPHFLTALRELRPPAFIVENPPGLVSHRKGETWQGILDAMRATGYAVAWVIIGACAIGAPHCRHRVFAVGRLRAHPGEAVRLSPERHVCGKRGLLLPTPVARDGDGRGEGDAAYWARKAARRAGQGIPLGAAVRLLPTPVRGDAKRGHNSTNNRGEIDLAGIGRLLPSPRAGDAANGGPNQGIASGDVALSSAVIGERWADFAPAVERWSEMTRPAPEPTEPTGRGGGHRLSPLLPEWMFGLPAGYLTDHVGRNAAIRLAGNGVVPTQAATAIRMLWPAVP